ncbi:DJ-1/PfpI family protein, partial [Vibrio parahaemolyticus V-223/04]
MAFWFMTA